MLHFLHCCTPGGEEGRGGGERREEGEREKGKEEREGGKGGRGRREREEEEGKEKQKGDSLAHGSFISSHCLQISMLFPLGGSILLNAMVILPYI